MQVITGIADLQAKIDECNRVMTDETDAALRRVFNSFCMDLSRDLPPDPFVPSTLLARTGFTV